MSHIAKLKVVNVKRIFSVTVEPDPNDPLVIVRGENGAGKSSLVDAIRYGMAGKSSHPPRVIREGETEAQVIIETDDMLVIDRGWKALPAGGSSTEVELRTKSEGKLKSPQALLDAMYANLALDSVAFMKLGPSEQRALLVKTTGVDTTLLEREHEKVFNERTVSKRDLAAAEARFKGYPSEKPPPAIDTSSLLKEQAEAQRLQEAAFAAKSEHAAAIRRMADTAEAVKVAEQALAQAKTRHIAAMKQAAQAENATEAADEAAAGAPETFARVRDELTRAQANAAAQARWQERTKAEEARKMFDAQVEAQTSKLNALRGQIDDIISKVKFPLEGLAFGQTGVMFKGYPLEQASQAEQLRVSVAMAAAMNPKFRVMLVRDGSLLDKKSVALLRELCREYKLQCWVEMVGEEGPASVIIRDGGIWEGA